MAMPTPEQKAEFERYAAEHAREPIPEEALKGVIDDDLAEAKAKENKVGTWNREYNSKTIGSSDKPQVAEAE